MSNEKNLAHWAAGSNKETVKEGVEDVSQDENLFEGDDA